MEKVFIDTNIFIRFFVQDDQVKFDEVVTFLEKVEKGKLRPYISSVVIGEVFYILHKLYKFPFTDVLMALDKMLSIRNMTLIEETNTKEAINLLKKSHIKLSDCLIASQLPDGVKLVTYDKEFSKIIKKVYIPKDFIEEMKEEGL
jgi:uncharacterized protein